jgi:RNA-splicing ligase RtcB
VNTWGALSALWQERFATDFERNEVMTDTTYNVLKPDNGVPIKAWTKGVPLEDAARQQLLNVAHLPFIYKWVAAMPDVHWGIGATVGSVIPTRGAIIPAAVGVDIGGISVARITLIFTRCKTFLVTPRFGFNWKWSYSAFGCGTRRDHSLILGNPSFID